MLKKVKPQVNRGSSFWIRGKISDLRKQLNIFLTIIRHTEK